MLAGPSGPRGGRPDDPHLQARTTGRTAADPPSFKTTILVWQPGDRIHLGSRTIQVVRVRRDDGGELPVLVVEDLS
jgi:hypothetical protein